MKINDLYRHSPREKPKEFTVKDAQSWGALMPVLWEAGKHHNIWLLEGDLGSGKTSLVKHLCRYLGYTKDVDSPTFSLINHYQWNRNNSPFLVHHIDLYRLNDLNEVIDIGLEEILDSDTLVLIEWPELARSLLPDTYFHLKLQHAGEQRKVLVL